MVSCRRKNIHVTQNFVTKHARFFTAKVPGKRYISNKLDLNSLKHNSIFYFYKMFEWLSRYVILKRSPSNSTVSS